MFLKKSLLFTTALALLLFAGQTSAQGPTVSLSHVPGEGGTEGMVAGQGTTFTVRISQTGVNAIPGIDNASSLDIDVAFDPSVLSITDSGVLTPASTESGATLTLLVPAGFSLSTLLPASVDLTFTTDVDVTDMEVSIGLTEARAVGLVGGSPATLASIPLTATLTLNEAETPVDPPDPPDPPDPVDPVPGDGSTVYLSSGGASIVRDVGAGAEVAVSLIVPGLTANVGGGKITFSVDPSVATITGVIPGASLVESESSGLTLVLAIPPMMLQGGALGSVTFTTNDDYDGGMFVIGVTSLELFTTDGVMSVAAGAPVVVNKPRPTLMGPDGDVMIMPGGSATAMVTAAGFVGDVTLDGAAEDGTVTATEAGEVTVTATDGIDPHVASVTINFVLGDITLSADPEGTVTIAPGGMGMVTVTASGQADGADVVFSEGATENEDGVSATVSASGAGTATVTASVGDVVSNEVTITFEMGTLELSADETTVLIGADGGMATVTASGQAEGADVVFSEGATENEDGVSATVSSSSAGMVTVSASVGDIMSNEVTITFAPSLHTESTTVTFGDFGESASATVTAAGFPEGANIRFRITGGAGFATADGATAWTVSTDKAGDVTMIAEDDMGNATAPLTITFANPDPYLTADPEIADVIIPDGGEVVVSVTATGLGDDISWTVTEVTGTATVNIDTDGATATLTAVDSDDLSQTSTVTLMASDGTMMTAPATVTFRKMPEVTTDMADVEVPQAVIPSGSSMVVAVGFPPAAEITFSVEVVEGSEANVSHSSEGNVLTLSATGTVTVSVTATGAGVTTAPVMVSFTQEVPAAPSSVVAQDNPGDNGLYVMVSFANSANHADVSQYRIYREMMVNTALDADGNVVTTDTPVATWVPWAVVDAMDNDEEGMTRAVVPVTDSNATPFGVAAESGQSSSEEVITPAGKRVFSKESVQAIVQLLGVDPNLVVTENELAEMLMPSADYIQSIIGDRKNVVFAALDPDLSVLIGDVTVPQNIRTDGHLGPIVSSEITPTDGMVAAVDDTAPAAVTDVTADPDTGLITWTVSADDGGVDAVMYRGHAIMIPHLVGYKVMAGPTPDAMTIDVTQLVLPETGVLPPGTSSLQVPRILIETLIDQGLPAVFVTIVAMDGTNVSGSVPLMVELAPKRKAFVDADGNPVYVVLLDRLGAMTPLMVDFEDFIAFRMAYNTSEATSTREEWRVFIQADLNDDTVVDFADFILFFGSYGKTAIGPSGKSLIPPLGVNENAEFLLRLGSDRVVAGETMFVDVSLANVQALIGYGFVLHYDAEIFEFVEAMPAAEDLLISSGGETPLFKSLSPEAGQVHVMNAIVNGSEVSGDGDIVRLVFRVLRNFEDNARFEIADGLVFDPSQLANPLAGDVLDIQTTPTEFALLQNFPNPFNPETTIGYELAESADVTLQIYNVVGQVVRTLMAAESQSVGRYQVRWDGMDDRGMPVSSGIYFYQISAGKFQDVRKLMLLK